MGQSLQRASGFHCTMVNPIEVKAFADLGKVYAT